jgi:hypothetical protein
MNLISKFIAVAVVTGVLIGTVNFSTVAFAGKAPDPNCFGEEASNLGKGGQMGEHSSNPLPDEDHDVPRDGIGNVGGHGSDTHPSELAEDLNGANNCETK